MISLTFGEQVKIVLSRKGMTIKELAEQIEARTGKKMSRQNLTQRLGRDNFQEQDMRLIAEILGCSFQLSILASVEAERASAIAEELPTDVELTRLAAKKELKQAKEEAKEELERDITVGEFVQMMADPVKAAEEAAKSVPADTGEELQKVEEIQPVEIEEKLEEKTEEAAEEEIEEEIEEEAVTELKETESVEEESDLEAAEEGGEGSTLRIEVTEKIMEASPAETEESEEAPAAHKKSVFSRKQFSKKKENPKDFEPIKKRADEDEDLQAGDVNPYTGHEYLTNSVRTHPRRIGYVQVYDRKTHKWTDMTEWAFLGFEERKKVTLGKDYEPPIYLD